MLKSSTVDIKTLIRGICKKKKWTRLRLSQELNVSKATVSRWASGKQGLHEAHRLLLEQLDSDVMKPESDVPEHTEIIQRGGQELTLPFSVRIPRDSLKVYMENGEIRIDGILVAKLNKEG